MIQPRTTPIKTPGKTTRLGFLKSFASMIAAAFAIPRIAAAFAIPKRLRANSQQLAIPKRRHKWGMVIDLDKCAGCRCCVVSCRLENNVPVAEPEQAALARSIFWMDMLSISHGQYASLQGHFLPVPCNHCESPPCVKVCPVGATFVNEDGIVAQIRSEEHTSELQSH